MRTVCIGGGDRATAGGGPVESEVAELIKR